MLWPVYNGRMPEKRLPKAFLHLLRKEWPFLIVLFVILLVCFLLVNYVAYKIGFRKKRLLRLLRENN